MHTPHHWQWPELLDGLSEAVLFINRQGRILSANRAALALHGADSLRALGPTLAGYRRRYRLHCRNGGETDPLSRMLAGEGFEETVVELRDVDAFGECRVCRLRSLMLGGLEGTDDAVALIFEDITERKRTETDLIHAIEAVMQESSWFGRTVIEKLANIRAARSDENDGDGAELADLTLREREVLGLICRGCSDKEMARELAVSAHTIRNHVSAVYAKLDVHKRGAAIVWARQRGFTGVPAQ